MGDPDLQQTLNELQQNLEYLYPMRDMSNQYPFRGDEELDLQAAMELMKQMQSIDELERQLERTQYGGEIDDIDADQLEDLLGPEARETLEELKKFLEILEEAGYIRKKGNNWELTPRGTRKIGQRALGEIFSQMKKDAMGRHETRETGQGGENTFKHQGLRVRRSVPPGYPEDDHELHVPRGHRTSGTAPPGRL